MLSKIKEKKWYLWEATQTLVKILRVDESQGRVVFHRYDSFTNDSISLEHAEMLFKPLFTIAEVARMLDKKQDTLRRYERKGLVPRVKQYATSREGNRKTRFYEWEDVRDLVQFFRGRRPVGRPSESNYRSSVDEKTIKQFVEARYKQIKNIEF